MSKFTIQLEGGQTLTRKLSALDAVTRQGIVKANQRTAIDVQREAKRNCPHFYGHLKASIKFTLSLGGLIGEVGTDLLYAAAVEFGAGPHVVPFRALFEWARLKFGLDDERAGATAAAVQKHIAETGTPPHPYLFPAWEFYRPHYMARLRQAFGIAAEKAAQS